VLSRNSISVIRSAIGTTTSSTGAGEYSTIGLIIGIAALNAKLPRMLGMLTPAMFPPIDGFILVIEEWPIGWLGVRVTFLGLDVVAEGAFALPERPSL
jgi:hypothetical protein